MNGRNPVDRPLLVGVLLLHALAIVRPVDVLDPVSAGHIGRLMLHGHLPYVGFAFEYPPLAALAFILPGLVPSAMAKAVLAVEAASLEGLVVWFVFLRPGHSTALRRYALLSFLLFPFLAGGFDALPMAAIALGAVLLAQGRRSGWAVAGLGVVAKASPGVLWTSWRTRTPTAFLVGVVAGGVSLLPVLVARHRDWDWVTYNLDRGVQVESVPATTVWFLRGLIGHSSSYAYRFRSYEVDHAGWAAALWAVVGVAVLLLLAVRGRLEPERLALVGVDAFLLASKVFSPQYVAWGAPLAALLGGPLFLAHLAMALLTVAAYAFAGSRTTLLGLVAVRNVILVGSVIGGAAGLLRSRRSSSASSSPNTGPGQ